MELYYFHIFLLASGHHEKTTHKLREQRNEQVWGSLMRRILTWLGLTHLWLSLAPSSIALWVCVLNRSVMSDSATPWTITPQGYPSMEFPRQEDWSGLPFPIPGDLPGPGIKPISLALFALWVLLLMLPGLQGFTHVLLSFSMACSSGLSLVYRLTSPVFATITIPVTLYYIHLLA